MPLEEVTIGSARLIRGDCGATLSALPAQSVHCCVTSPPYYGLRDYGVEGQIGLEPTPEAYVERMVSVFREVRRVLRNDGTLWLNLGDSYASNGEKKNSRNGCGLSGLNHGRGGNKYEAAVNAGKPIRISHGLKPKDLIGIPWMLAFALRADGWYLRQDIIWAKPNPMPESVTDRCTKAHEYLFLLTKSARYYYDAEAVKEKATDTRGGLRFTDRRSFAMGRKPSGNERSDREADRSSSRNRRSVWTIATAPFRGAHFATFPPALVEPCILAGTSERGVCPKCGAPWERVIEERHQPDVPDSHTKIGILRPRSAGRHHIDGSSMNNDPAKRPPSAKTIGWHPTCSCDAVAVSATVIDPFAGASTTALVADRLGRRSVSIELSAAYFDIACRRIEAAQIAAAA